MQLVRTFGSLTAEEESDLDVAAAAGRTTSQ